jgi:hypothetical protein
MSRVFTRIAVASILTVAVAASANASPVNLVTNDNFSSTSGNSTTPNGWTTYTPSNVIANANGSSNPAIGITSQSSTQQIPYNAAFPSPVPGGGTSAAYFVDDNSLVTNPETIAQVLKGLLVGQQYTLSIAAEAPVVGDLQPQNPNSAYVSALIGGSLNTSTGQTSSGTLIGTVGVKGPSGSPALPASTAAAPTDVIGSTDTWYTETFTFTATAMSELLAFDYISGPSTAEDLFLTDAVVTATPLPSTAALLLPVFFAGLGLLAARRRKGTDHLAFLAS